jgi:hypothetical protein
MCNRLWIGILDTAGVWWLIRRAKRVPQPEEITLGVDPLRAAGRCDDRDGNVRDSG